MKKIKIYAFLFTFLLIVIFIVTFLSSYFSDRVDIYMKSKSENYCAKIVRDVLEEEVLNWIDSSELVSVKYRSENVVSSISVNTRMVNSFLKSVNENLLLSIEEIEKVRLDIPIGAIFSDSLFGDVGPSFKIRIVMLSSFETDVYSEMKEYGINSSLFELFVKVKFTVNTMIPLNENLLEIEVRFPLVIEIINGEVPRYYYNTNDIVPDVYDN